MGYIAGWAFVVLVAVGQVCPMVMLGLVGAMGVGMCVLCLRGTPQPNPCPWYNGHLAARATPEQKARILQACGIDPVEHAAREERARIATMA